MTGWLFVRRTAEPVLWFAGLLLIWQVSVRVLGVPVFVLPAPSDFIAKIVEEHQRLLHHGLITTRLILIGFVAGTVPGVILAYLIAKFRLAEQIIYPIVIFIQGLLKVTLAPLMLVWFGFSDLPKILLTALITFFPVLVDSVTGFKSIDRARALPIWASIPISQNAPRESTRSSPVSASTSSERSYDRNRIQPRYRPRTSKYA